MAISLLTPTRGRPENVQRLMDSAFKFCRDPKDIEFVFWIDDDDNSYDIPKLEARGAIVLRGPRIVLAQMWNECWKAASGPYYLHTGDDIVFKTSNWDALFVKPFEESDDKILFVHGDDKGPRGREFGTHGMVHKNWTDTVGRFVPPYFASDWCDAWFNDVANALGRRRFVPVVTEHFHPIWGKAEWDLTHQERMHRHATEDCDGIYAAKAPERIEDVRKLQEFIECHAGQSSS